LPSKNKKILVAMSGGVDSSVAAALLLEKNYEVQGIFMKFWNPGIVSPLQKNTGVNIACARENWVAAKKVARKLGIKIKAVNFQKVFKERVVDEFLGWQRFGLTPNPCIVCNQKVKFGEFLKFADQEGADSIATGHYVQIKESEGRYSLYRGADSNKDQSYFLYRLKTDQLSRIVFPLGNRTKPEIRDLAKHYDLPVAGKSESQEICFVPDNNHPAFLHKYLKFAMKPGDIVDKSGQVLGEHIGLPAYTIGQRRGIKIGGIGPFFVLKKDLAGNKLIVTKDEKDLLSDSFTLLDIHWVGASSRLPLSCRIQVRYRSPAIPGEVIKSDEKLTVRLEKPLRAITPGQAAVFYEKDMVLGGGVIKENNL